MCVDYFNTFLMKSKEEDQEAGRPQSALRIRGVDDGGVVDCSHMQNGS